MSAVDRSVLWRAALVQALAVAVLSIALAVALPHSFFEDWGWLAGPGAWILCALVTARVVRLPIGGTLVGAALAGLPSVVAVILGVHWLGAVLAIAVFALWCARLARDRGLTARAASHPSHGPRLERQGRARHGRVEGDRARHRRRARGGGRARRHLLALARARRGDRRRDRRD